jgi:hypothetical protein
MASLSSFFPTPSEDDETQSKPTPRSNWDTLADGATAVYKGAILADVACRQTSRFTPSGSAFTDGVKGLGSVAFIVGRLASAVSAGASAHAASIRADSRSSSGTATQGGRSGFPRAVKSLTVAGTTFAMETAMMVTGEELLNRLIRGKSVPTSHETASDTGLPSRPQSPTALGCLTRQPSNGTGT